MRPLLLLIAGTLGFALLQKPSETEVMERMLKDQHLGEIVTCLQKRGRLDPGKTIELRNLSGKRLASLAQLFKMTPRERLNRIFRAGNDFEYDLPTHGLVLSSIEFIDVIPPQEALKIMRPRLEAVPAELRCDLLELIGTNAHAVGSPQLAVECYRLAARNPQSKWTTLQQMAQTFRWEGLSGEAAQILRQWLAKHGNQLSDNERTGAEELDYALSLEAGQPSMAFDHLLAQLKALPLRGAPSADLIEQATKAAMFAGRGGEVVPWVESYLKTLPGYDVPWKKLRALAAAKPEKFAELKHWWSTLARLDDWSGRCDLAYDYHLRCAALGDQDSLDRCVSQYKALGRTEECAELLQSMDAVPDKYGGEAMLAALLGNLGRETEACALFLKRIARHPDDRDARFNLACLYEDLAKDDDCVAQLEQLLEHHPDDTAAINRLANARMRRKEFSSALTLLSRTEESMHNDETLEGYASLAESLDQQDLRVKALQMSIVRKARPEPRDYLELADAAGYSETPELAKRFLREGIERLPSDASIRLALANLHAEEKDYPNALSIAMAPEIRDLFETKAFILSLAPHVKDAEMVLEFLGDDFEKKSPLSSHDRLDLAVLHHKAGHAAEAGRLFASVPETLPNLREISAARYHCEDYREAERLTLEFINKSRATVPSDWVFLGDLYQLMNLPEEAERAYNQSISLLTSTKPLSSTN